MEELNLGDLVGQPYGTHQHFSVSINNVYECVVLIDFIFFKNNRRRDEI